METKPIIHSDSYITMPKGFKANGVCCNMKGNGNLDMALVYSELPCVVAGVYTSNLVKGHSLTRSIDIINKQGPINGIVINSKVANSCVGQIGVADAEQVASEIATKLGISSENILTASTGVIGTRLLLDKMLPKVDELVSGLGDDEESGHKAMRAIMTTDTVPKEVSATVTLKDGAEITIAAMAKGSGMIHPNLATMISVFTTDAAISCEKLFPILKRSVSHTFNRVSVDGDTSVCDSVMVFANGASGVTIDNSEDLELFEEAMTKLSEDLARMIAADGEGATKLIEIEVFGAKDANDAKLIVTSIARSPLCKTAIFGMDANFGRFITACGYSGASFDPNKIDLYLGDMQMYKDGIALDIDEDAAVELLKEHDVYIKVVLYEGDAYDRMFTCDFSYDYVEINGSYRS